MKEKLQKIRSSIDEIDRNIISLLEERMSFVAEVAELKHANPNISYIRADREAQMLRDLLKSNQKLPKQIIIQIWRLIISMSLQQECSFTIFAHCKEPQKEYVKRLVREYFSALTGLEYTEQIKLPESAQSLLACLYGDEEQYKFLLEHKEYKIFSRLPDLGVDMDKFQLSEVNILAIISEELLAYDRVICAIEQELVAEEMDILVNQILLF